MSRSGWKLNNFQEEWITRSAEETIHIGIEIGQRLAPHAILCFFGDLGSGKTTFIKGIVKGVTGISSEEVTSPTFVYMTPYQGQTGLIVYHFDLYRLGNPEEFLFMGFEEYLHAGGICCIEWSEKIAPFLPKRAVAFHLMHLEQGKRKIRYDHILL